MPGVTVNLNLNLTELPDCPCGKGKQLPVEDTTQTGVSYLKGWFCPSCKAYYLFKNGDMYCSKVNDAPGIR